MPDGLRIEGEWPSPLVIRKGWARGFGRPWNDEHRDASIRLDRGGAGFLRQASKHLADLGGGAVFSPALTSSATRTWRKAGFIDHVELDVMERPLSVPIRPAAHPTTSPEIPDLDRLVEVDNDAFEGFWRIGAEGINESLKATPTAAVILAGAGDDLAGYSVVGIHLGTSFLQRIAVRPELEGKGYGSSMLSAALLWARRRAARSMVLNVRTDSERARQLYLHHGFTTTTSRLGVLRFDG